MTNYVSDKVIIITGAASGFGKLVSEMACAMGAKVMAADVNAEVLDATVAAIQASGGSIAAKVTDVTDRAAVHELAAATVETFGRIDVIINNAGTMPLAFYGDHAAATWSRLAIVAKFLILSSSSATEELISNCERRGLRTGFGEV